MAAEHDPYAERADECGLLRQRMAELAVRRDRVANEAAWLVALVEDRDVVAEGGELAGAGEAGGPGADDGDADARSAARAGGAGGPPRARRRRRGAGAARSRSACGPRGRGRTRPRRGARSGTRGRTCRRAGCRRRSAPAAARGRRRDRETKAGTSMPAGQATVQGAGACALPHSRQRSASMHGISASSGGLISSYSPLSPRAASSSHRHRPSPEPPSSWGSLIGATPSVRMNYGCRTRT